MKTLLFLSLILLAPFAFAQENSEDTAEANATEENQKRAQLGWPDDEEDSLKVRRIARGLSGGSAGANIRFDSDEEENSSEELMVNKTW